jgi:hypothetical protein
VYAVLAETDNVLVNIPPAPPPPPLPPDAPPPPPPPATTRYSTELGVDAAVVVPLLAALLALLPAAFVAYTVNVYVVPAVNPLTLIVPEPAWLSVAVILPGLDVAV